MHTDTHRHTQTHNTRVLARTHINVSIIITYIQKRRHTPARDRNCLLKTSSQWLSTAASSGTTSIVTLCLLLTPSASATAFNSDNDCSFFSRAAAMHAAVSLRCSQQQHKWNR